MKKCAACGMPLSPNRQQATCPRCGAPVSAPAAQHAGMAQAGFFAPSFHNAPNARNNQSPTPPVEPGWQPGLYERGDFGRGGPANRGQSPRNNRMGFTIAGLCIAAGALLLVFVYILAIGGQGSSDNANGTQTTLQTTTSPSPTPTSIPSPTPTPFLGQQYIDNAQLSSSPPPSLQVTSTFKTGQKIYVVFDLHPQGQSGEVCLVWYLNGQQATSYQFAVSGNNHTSYAYAILGSTGPGYVDLLWATNATCSNGQIAQQVNFTVTN